MSDVQQPIKLHETLSFIFEVASSQFSVRVCVNCGSIRDDEESAAEGGKGERLNHANKKSKTPERDALLFPIHLMPFCIRLEHEPVLPYILLLLLLFFFLLSA